MTLKAGAPNKAKDFSLLDMQGQTATLERYAGKWVVLYFYPKDNTSGCTTEALDFTARIQEFKALGCAVAGISPDSVASHCRFSEKHQLDLELLSDPEKTSLEAFGVWKLKSMYGRQYYGVERSTFLLDPSGHVRAEWRKVKVSGHVDEVLARLRELQGSPA